MTHSLVLFALLLMPPGASGEADESASRMLALTPDAASRLDKAQRAGVLELAPVHLPGPDAGPCNHFGWPIATMSGDTLVLVCRHIPGHNPKGAGQPDESMSYGIVLRSEDGGHTWSKPYDLRDSMSPEDRQRAGLVPVLHRAKWDKDNPDKHGYKVVMHAIGTTRDGAVVSVNPHGVFRSEDQGRTWKHFPTALREDTLTHKGLNPGPQVFDDPSRGLLIFGSGDAGSPILPIFSSGDGGATWRVEDFPVGFFQAEPSAVLYEGRYLIVTRDQTSKRSHQQITWQPGQKPQILDTNLQDPRLVDTVDLSFNPVTRRLELVRSERYRMELWVWSMAPSDWDKGQWTRECRLLGREGVFYKTSDGFHPAGAVIDAKRGVQHIFVYSGHPNGPAGVFRITRTLDTAKLSAALAP